MAEEGLPTRTACWILDVFWVGVPRLADRTHQTGVSPPMWSTAPGGCGAELTSGRVITVSHGAVEMLMKHAGITGLPGRKRRRTRSGTPTVADWLKTSASYRTTRSPEHERLLDGAEATHLDLEQAAARNRAHGVACTDGPTSSDRW